MSSAATAEPLRFVLVSTAYPPSDDRAHAVMWADVAAELVRRGHGVTVLTARDAAVADGADEGGVLVQRRLRERGAATTTRGHSSLLGARHDCSSLRRAARAAEADVIVFADLMGATAALLAVRPRAGGAVLCDATTGWMEDVANGGGAWFRHWSARAPTFGARLSKGLARAFTAVCLGVPTSLHALPPGPVFATAPEALSRLREVAPDLAPGRLVEPGIDLRLFAGVARRTPAEGRRLLYAGPIARDHGLHTAMLALGDLPPDVRLRIVGEMQDPEYMAEVAAMGRAAGVMERVELSQSVDEDELPSLLAGADALVVTSHVPDRFPRLVLQAFAAETVVVGTTSGARADVLRDGETGFTFAPGNAHELARKLTRLLGDRELEARVAMTARLLVEQHYSVGYTAAQVERLARGALEAARTGDG